MEQIKDFRLTATPPAVLLTCITLLVLRIGLSIYEFSNPQEKARAVSWQAFSSSVPEADTSKKIKLYEFYADWCSPCQRLEKDVMSNGEIRELIENKFVPVRVTDRQREDGKNSKEVYELQKKYRVFAFPTLVAVGPDGESVGMLVGNSSSLAVYRFLSRALNDSDQSKDHNNLYMRAGQKLKKLFK